MNLRTLPLVSALLVVAALVATGVSVAVNRHEAKELAPPVPTASSVIESQADAPEDDSAGRVVFLTLGPTGFEPGELQISPGDYLFVVRNRSGLDEVGVRLLRDNGQNLHEVKISGRREWKQLVKLRPGKYLIQKADHPEWMCWLTVEQ